MNLGEKSRKEKKEVTSSTRLTLERRQKASESIKGA